MAAPTRKFLHVYEVYTTYQGANLAAGSYYIAKGQLGSAAYVTDNSMIMAMIKIRSLAT